MMKLVARAALAAVLVSVAGTVALFLLLDGAEQKKPLGRDTSDSFTFC